MITVVTAGLCLGVSNWDIIISSSIPHHYIHKLTHFSHRGRQKLQNATCCDPYILLIIIVGIYLAIVPYFGATSHSSPSRRLVLRPISDLLNQCVSLRILMLKLLHKFVFLVIGGKSINIRNS